MNKKTTKKQRVSKAKKSVDDQKPRLIIRNANLKDIVAIRELVDQVYPNDSTYSKDMLRGQMNTFSIGQFVAEFEGKIVGYCATFIIEERFALKPHTWDEITGRGFASKHNPEGDYLYGMEVCVDPKARRMRIGQRFYDERKKLCRYLRLKGIVFAGRLPGYRKKSKNVKSPEDYIEQVRDKKIRDQVLSFQLRQGFEVIGILKNYIKADKESMGFAAHLLWRNPEIETTEENKRRSTDSKFIDTIRVGSIQYKQRRVESFDQFAKYVEYFVDVVADYRGDFVVFPELFTLQLLSIENQKLNPQQSVEALTKYTAPVKKMFSDLAIKYNINIIGGSHPTKSDNGKILNICYVFLRDGSIHEQIKIHPTPNERYWWNVEGGDKVEAINTDCGPIGVLICYDSEFPELARHLINQGAKILFVPFCTDERQSYLRVRYCCQARAVENQCYVVMSGNVGNLPGVQNMDIQYAQSSILTPCDFPFARDGIAADTTPNVEMVAFADLRVDLLNAARNNGTVQNLKDRRFDLYSVKWENKDHS